MGQTAVSLKDAQSKMEIISTREDIELVETGRTYAVALELIERNLDQPRQNITEEMVNGRAASIKRRGVEDSIKVVVRDGGSGKFFLIVDGEIRWRAAKVAGLKYLSCLIKPPMTKDEIYLSSAKANGDRYPFNPFEEAEIIVQFKKRFGWGQARAAQELGKSEGYISNIMKYLNLCEQLKEKLMKGELDKAVALNLASFQSDKQEKINSLYDNFFLVKRGGKKLNPRDIPRAMKCIAKKIEVAPKQGERGKKHRTHPDLVISNLERAMDNLDEAIKEVDELADKEITGQKSCHIIDLINRVRNCHEHIGVLAERIDALD